MRLVDSAILRNKDQIKYRFFSLLFILLIIFLSSQTSIYGKTAGQEFQIYSFGIKAYNDKLYDVAIKE